MKLGNVIEEALGKTLKAIVRCLNLVLLQLEDIERFLSGGVM